MGGEPWIEGSGGAGRHLSAIRSRARTTSVRKSPDARSVERGHQLIRIASREPNMREQASGYAKVQLAAR